MDKFVYRVKGTCKECGSENLVRDIQKGEVCCRDCGVVLKEKEFSQQDNRQTVGFYGRYP